jgi:alpha-L-rhamnosidase
VAANPVPATAVAAPATQYSTSRKASITDFGAKADGLTINTAAIQRAIDALAATGGTVVIPEGTFVSGALFLKPHVNVHLDKGAVLKGSTDIKDYPTTSTRIEGHFQDWLPALINASACDGLVIDGDGTLDGSGQPFWDRST